MTEKEPALIHEYGPLQPGILLKRYKRFLADVRLPDGQEITVFTPNSGSMKSCSDPGSPVMLSRADKRGRKTDFTLEMVRSGMTWVGVNTGLPNHLAARVIDRDLTGQAELSGFRVLRREVAFGASRLDLLAGKGDRTCYVEVKNVTYREGSSALFPDAVTTRGKKHLKTLMAASKKGHMAVNVFVVQRSDCDRFAPAWAVDPSYSETFNEAAGAGVWMIPLLFHVTPEAVFFRGALPLGAS